MSEIEQEMKDLSVNVIDEYNKIQTYLCKLEKKFPGISELLNSEKLDRFIQKFNVLFPANICTEKTLECIDEQVNYVIDMHIHVDLVKYLSNFIKHHHNYEDKNTWCCLGDVKKVLKLIPVIYIGELNNNDVRIRKLIGDVVEDKYRKY